MYRAVLSTFQWLMITFYDNFFFFLTYRYSLNFDTDENNCSRFHDLDLKATGCQSLCFCSRTAPIPNLDELHVIFAGSFGSKNFRELFSLIIDLSLLNWFRWVVVKSQMEVFLTSSLNWWVFTVH